VRRFPVRLEKAKGEMGRQVCGSRITSTEALEEKLREKRKWFGTPLIICDLLLV
jgi:hypothetical protein